jgi:DNA (cytosine-5)-methyltransferase 1
MENVKNLVSKKHKENFFKWLKVLESYGYKNYWEVLNATDYKVPQNRERVFCISILGDQGYLFPNPSELKLRLKDLLENEVDEKFYLKKEIQNRFVYKNSPSIIAGNTNPSQKGMNGNVYKIDSFAPTLTTNKGEGIKIINATKKTGFLYATDGDGIDLNYPDSKTRRGRVQPQQAHTLTTTGEYGVLELAGTIENNWTDQMKRVYLKEGISPTLDTMQGRHRQPKILENFRIRKLTPLECWRLMDVSDEDFYKVKNAGISDSQLYKLAGNSIVCNVLVEIFRNLFK